MKLVAGILALAMASLLSSVAVAGEQTVTLEVDGMDCAACPLIVKRSLTKVEGVRRVQVSYERKTAVVTFDDAKTTVARLIDATTEAGYPSQVLK